MTDAERLPASLTNVGRRSAPRLETAYADSPRIVKAQ